MRIIPAIDILGGKCVRLSQGHYNSSIVYNENPLHVAKHFEANGMRYLHLVDLDGAKSNRIINYSILEQIATNTNLIIDFGGGIKSSDDAELAFKCGASQISCGSIAVQNKTLFLKWVEKYGPEKVLLGADSLNRRVAIQGWEKQSETDIVEFIKQYEALGVRSVVCTDISRDGMLQGPAGNLYREILQSCDVNLIASGGVSSLEDLHSLKMLGLEGVIIGKALYEGYISIHELSMLC